MKPKYLAGPTVTRYEYHFGNTWSLRPGMPGVNPDPHGTGKTQIDGVRDVESFVEIELKNSVSSPRPPNDAGWIKVPGLSRTGKVLLKPVKPVYKLPYRKPLVEPKRDTVTLVFNPPNRDPMSIPYQRAYSRYLSRVEEAEKQADARFANAQVYFFHRQQVRLAFVERYKATYERRIAKYYRRLIIYQKRRAIADRQLANPRNKARLVSAKYHAQNPYFWLSFKNGTAAGIELRCTRQHHAPPPPGGRYDYSIITWAYPMSSFALQPGDLSSAEIRYAFADEIVRLRLKVNHKLVDKIKNQKYHLAMILAERGQTLDVAKAILQRLQRVVAWRRNLGANLGKGLGHYLKKGVFDDVLAVNFGIRPLAEDLLNIVEDAKRLDPDLAVMAFRSLARLNVRRTINLAGAAHNFEGVVTLRKNLRYRMVNPFARLLDELGLLNVAETAWEAAPWSFVVDWVIPISDWLSSISAKANVEFQKGTETLSIVGRITSCATVGSISPVADLTPLSYLAEGEDRYEETLAWDLDGDLKVIDRILLSNPEEDPIPFDLIGSIHFPKFSITRMINSIALTGQRASKILGLFR